MSSYVFQIFCEDGKAGAQAPAVPAPVPAQLALQHLQCRPPGPDQLLPHRGFKQGPLRGEAGKAGEAVLPAEARETEPGSLAMYRHLHQVLRDNGGPTHSRPSQCAKLAHLA